MIEQQVTDWVEQYLQAQLSSRVLLDRRVGLHKACSAGVELGRHESRATIAQLKETLHELTCEAQGFLSQADPMTHGVTNIQVLMQKIEKAREAYEQA